MPNLMEPSASSQDDAAQDAGYAAGAFDFGRREVYLANGGIVPIVQAEECRDRVHIVIVAGPTKAGHFIVYKINPEEYEELDLVEKS